jgi:hypothetical protein
MTRIRRPEPDTIFEALTPEREIDGLFRRAIGYLGMSRKGKRSSDESPGRYYDICGKVSAEGLEKLVEALQVVGILDDGVDLKRRPHDPYDPHSTRMNGWTDLSV